MLRGGVKLKVVVSGYLSRYELLKFLGFWFWTFFRDLGDFVYDKIDSGKKEVLRDKSRGVSRKHYAEVQVESRADVHVQRRPA